MTWELLELSNRARLVCQSQSLQDGVVNRRSELADLLVGPAGIHTVREQNDEKAAVGIDPKRCASEAGMAETGR